MRDQSFGICHKYMPFLKSCDALNYAVCPCKASGVGGISLGAILRGEQRLSPCTVFRKDVSSAKGAGRGGKGDGEEEKSHSTCIPFQLNHFPGSFQIGRKDRLWRNLLKMQARCGKKEFNFFPQSFILPQDIKLLRKAWEEGASRQKWIVKPVGVKQNSVLCPFVAAGRRSDPFLFVFCSQHQQEALVSRSSTNGASSPKGDHC